MAKLLLTGAAGFIGSWVARELLGQGSELVGVDNFNSYYDPRLKQFRITELKKKFANIQVVEGQVQDESRMRQIFQNNKFDAVINLAAMAGVRNSLLHPKDYFRSNLDGTLNLLELCKEFNVSKFILASTSSLYAGLPLPFDENLPVNTPLSPYAASKKSAEMLCYTYHRLFQIDVSIPRFFTVYGPMGRPDMSYFRFIRAIAEGTPITLYGDGTQGRDFTYVTDIARGVVAALRPLGCEAINLGGGQNPIPVNTMISILERLLGKTAIIERKPFHKADMKDTWAEVSKASRLLSWQPTTSLEQGLQQCVSWYLENQEFVKTLNTFQDEG